MVTPEDEGYDEAGAVYNAHDRPAAGRRRAPRDVGDVMAAVDLARENGLDLAVRGGGHSVPGFGTCDGGVVVDLSGMRGVRVDPAAGRRAPKAARTWGDFNARHVPVRAGHDRRHHLDHRRRRADARRRHRLPGPRRTGCRCDNLISADVVTADGRFVIGERDGATRTCSGRCAAAAATSASSPRSSSGCTRSRTSTAARCSSSSSDAERRPAVLPRVHRRRARGARRVPGVPDRAAAAVHPRGPARRAVPRDRRLLGRDRSTRARRALKPFRDVAPVVAELVGPMPYPALNSAFDALVPPGLQHYWKANFVTELTDEAIERT